MIETLIAAMILSIAMGSISYALYSKIKRFSNSRNQTLALIKLQNQINLFLFQDNEEKLVEPNKIAVSQGSSLTEFSNLLEWLEFSDPEDETKTKLKILAVKNEEKK